MITFFRRIRKSLLNSGQGRKYIIYALGEIALVVIGILIALQINNWNENRIDRSDEQVLVNTLYDELQENKAYINDYLYYLYKTTEVSGLYLLSLCRQNRDNSDPDSLLAHIRDAFHTAGYSPKVSSFNQVTNSEAINLIQSDSLKKMLGEYASLLNLSYQISDQLYSSNEIWSYTHKSFGGFQFGAKFKEREVITVFDGLEPATNRGDIIEVLSDIEFESLLVSRLLTYNWTVNRLKQMNAQIDALMKFIENHYDIE